MLADAKPRTGDVIVLVGTRKGAFILSGGKERKDWSISGPHMLGGDVFHMRYDPRNGAIYSATNNVIWGPDVQISHDLGDSWSSAEQPPRFPNEPERVFDPNNPFGNSDGKSVKNVWHIEPGRESEPGVVYAGVDPAALFKSTDSGKTWHEVDGFNKHPTREKWMPGAGGLCLHSMVLDPTNNDRMWVGASAVGVFGTADGGQSWHPMNKGVRADFFPENRYPEFGQCTHKLLSHPAKPNTLLQQNHCGVFRCDNGGEDWQDVTEGLPSRFGFVLGLHSQDPDTMYVMPEDKATGDEVGGMFRVVSDGKMRVYRTRNGGGDWEPLTKGLPQKHAYIHSMREGMATDSLDPCGIYVGTSTGQVFYSRDDGDSWELMVEYLPPINSVECGIVG